MLEAVDITLPRWALRIEDLVSIEDKRRFVDVILPALLEQVAPEGASAQVQRWLEDELSTYGNKAHLLFSEAMRAYINKNRPANGEALTALFT